MGLSQKDGEPQMDGTANTTSGPALSVELVLNTECADDYSLEQSKILWESWRFLRVKNERTNKNVW